MARPAGFEPATSRLGSECSIQLSYGRIVKRDVSLRAERVPQSKPVQCTLFCRVSTEPGRRGCVARDLSPSASIRRCSRRDCNLHDTRQRMDEIVFRTLLLENESTRLDFKQQQYPFVGADDGKKSELLKDVLAFANSWRTDTALSLIHI